ncbi:MAG: hypothetical protein JO094_06260 [Hyphomicrobiales bacterium]|nr:hypothetical protein [Hyphomicrobiales bacterium]
MTDLASSLAQMRGAWLTGGSAIEHCPDTWRSIVECEDEPALVALAGHAASVLFRPAPATPLAVRPLLPRLGLRVILETERARFRRVLAHKTGAVTGHAVTSFMAARGFAPHPADWLPSPGNDETAEVFTPWLDWVRGEPEAPPDLAMTLETYDSFPFASRCAALAARRRSDPDAARAIIAAKARTEPAERRNKLVAILETKLSVDDGEFLASLATDRSERVQELARTLLARLGRVSGEDALATELAAMMTLGKIGLLRRRSRVTMTPLKTSAQEARRRELLGRVSLKSLSDALGATDTQLLEASPVGKADVLGAFARMIAKTGSDAACERLLELVLEDKEFPLAEALALVRRRRPAQARAVAPRILQRDDRFFATTLAFVGPVGEVTLAALTASPSFSALLRAMETARGAEDAKRTEATRLVESGLDRLGVLASPEAASEIMARLAAMGLSAADPKLDMLQLNAALIPETRP